MNIEKWELHPLQGKFQFWVGLSSFESLFDLQVSQCVDKRMLAMVVTRTKSDV